jgi:hypothetical protein
MTASLRVGISGSSGLIGTALREALEGEGHVAVRIVRRVPGDGEIGWDPSAGRLDPTDIAGLDAVVNLSGAGIGDHRWTDEYRATIRESRTATSSLIAETFAQLGGDAPGVLVNASAIGYYGDRGDDVLTEEAAPGTGFLPDVCQDWEAATRAAADVSRVVNVRTGIVLTKGGGALGKMVPLFKFGLGGRFGNGHQWMSWISLHDEVRAIIHALTSPDLSGPVNLTAPNPVTNREFTEALGTAVHRPTIIPVPAFGPKLLLGSELAEALLFDSARVVPSALDGDGFTFDHADLAEALAFVLSTNR